MYWAACSSIGSLKTLCSRLAMTVTCSRRLAASSRSSAVSGGSSPDHDRPGTLTMYQRNHAVSAARSSQKSMRQIRNRETRDERREQARAPNRCPVDRLSSIVYPDSADRLNPEVAGDLVESSDQRRG